MRKYRKTFNINKIKPNFPYYVSDLTEKLGVTKGTVYLWFKEGLQPIDDKTPFIIPGSELCRFLKKRQQDRKRPCHVNEMFCLKCQRPRRAQKGKTSLQTSKGRKPNLTGKCIICNSQMNKAISLKNLPEIAKHFELEQPHNLHIVDCLTATTNHNKNIGE
jgi:hypothetical protein